MKEKIVQLIKDMHVDSKSKSYEAEKKLCKILTEVINKKYADEMEKQLLNLGLIKEQIIIF